MESLRLTPLDPSRPALDLLEDLLSGIHGCLLIAYYDAECEELMAAFIEAVRAEAAERHDRLL
jgi:hypothetical protein